MAHSALPKTPPARSWSARHLRGAVVLICLAIFIFNSIGTNDDEVVDRNTPAIEYATTADADRVRAECRERLGPYASNRYDAIKAASRFDSEVTIGRTADWFVYRVEMTVEYTNDNGLEGSDPLDCVVSSNFVFREFQDI